MPPSSWYPPIPPDPQAWFLFPGFYPFNPVIAMPRIMYFWEMT
jgi:hypothetical protein